MPTWNSRGLRGSTLEDLLNRTNEKYAHNGLALIQKIPTPITPINIDKETRHITLAYFSFDNARGLFGVIVYIFCASGAVISAICLYALSANTPVIYTIFRLP